MKFMHIRGPSGGVVTVCYRHSDEWALVGMSFSSPKERCWVRKKGNAIAKGRAHDSPLQIHFVGLAGQVSPRLVKSVVRSLAIENPKWEEGDMNPIRPSRFTERWNTDLLGPDGLLFKVWIDVKPERPGREICIVPGINAPVEATHWAIRMPGWARALLKAS